MAVTRPMPKLARLLASVPSGNIGMLADITLAEAEIRVDERLRIADEMAALKRELEQADRKMAAGLVMNMWQTVTRRLDR